MTEVLDRLMADEGGAQEETRSDYPIKMNRFDHYAADEMRNLSGEWKDIEAKKQEEWQEYPKAMDTFFSALYKPKAQRSENLTRTGRALSQLLDSAEQTKEWQKFRRDTMLDEVASAMGAIHLARALELPDMPDPEEQLPPGLMDKLPAPISDEEMDKIRRQIRKAVKEAQKDIEEQKEMEAVMWGNDTGALLQGRDPQERLHLATELKRNPRVKRLLDLVGKFRIIAHTKYKNRTIHGRDELVGIKLGDNLRDVVPDELAYLMDEDFEDLFFLNWIEGQLLEYEFKANEKVGKGPIVARIDVSGSMGSMLRGPNQYGLPNMTKLEWAIATALALAVIAKKEERNLSIGFFNTVMVKEFIFEKGQATPEQIMEIASFGLSGGTDFEVPLVDALARLNDSEYSEGDVLFLSDGECSVSHGFLEAWDEVKKTKKFKAFAVLFHHSSSPVLDRLCDGVVQISDLAEADNALDMAFTL